MNMNRIIGLLTLVAVVAAMVFATVFVAGVFIALLLLLPIIFIAAMGSFAFAKLNHGVKSSYHVTATIGNRRREWRSRD